MMSSVVEDGRNAATATRVGGDLRAARERLGWSLPDLAAHLRIRLPFLKAIEDGRICDLPGNAYAVGFVRTYANSLGLAPDEIARRFREEAADVNRKTELTFPAPVPDRGVPAGAVVLLGAVLAIGAYVGWYRMSGDGQPAADAVQPVPEHLAVLADPPPLAAPPVTQQAAVTPAPMPPTLPAASSPIQTPSISPIFAAAAVPATPPAPAPAVASPAPAPAPVPATTAQAAPATPPAADGGRIVLRATADAWMQVRDRQGPVLLNRVLRSGETWAVPNRGQLLLTTGNAGGTELLVDGEVTPSLGGNGSVRRDLPLDPDLIRDGKFAVAATAPHPALRQQ